MNRECLYSSCLYTRPAKVSQQVPENASKMLAKCVQNSFKTIPRHPQERLGTSLGTMLAPKGAPGTKKMRKGSAPFPAPAPSWELFDIIFPWFFHVIFCSFFQFQKIKIGSKIIPKRTPNPSQNDSQIHGNMHAKISKQNMYGNCKKLYILCHRYCSPTYVLPR